jgi:hypothetical protein
MGEIAGGLADFAVGRNRPAIFSGGGISSPIFLGKLVPPVSKIPSYLEKVL